MRDIEFNELIQNIHKKNCFEKLYNEYFPIIVKFIIRNFNDANLGQDVAHDLFTGFLHNKIDYVRNPNAYIFTAAHNLALKYVKNNEKYNLVDCVEIYSLFDVFDKTEINVAIIRLDNEEKDIIELKWLFGYNFNEIAKMKGCTLFAIQKRHQRILKKLKSFLK